MERCDEKRDSIKVHWRYHNLLIIQQIALYSYAQWNLEVPISLWLDKGLVGSDAWNDSGLSERQRGEKRKYKQLWNIPSSQPHAPGVSISLRCSFSLSSSLSLFSLFYSADLVEIAIDFFLVLFCFFPHSMSRDLTPSPNPVFTQGKGSHCTARTLLSDQRLGVRY